MGIAYYMKVDGQSEKKKLVSRGKKRPNWFKKKLNANKVGFRKFGSEMPEISKFKKIQQDTAISSD